MQKKKKNLGGRPTKMTKATIDKLEAAFTAGATILQACDWAHISADTYYNYGRAHPGFFDSVAQWRARLGLRAKLNVQRAIVTGDEDVSRWYLEKTDDAFNPKKRAEITGEGGGAVQLAFGWMDEKED